MIIFNVKLATLQEENEKSFCDLDTEKTVGICCHITDTYKTLHLISKVFFVKSLTLLPKVHLLDSR